MNQITTKQLQLQKIKIIASALVGSLGSGIFSFGIGLMILRETGSATNFGFSQMIGPILAVLLLPITGSIVDKYNRKMIVIFSQLFSIGGIVLFLIGNSMAILPKLVLIYLLLIVLRMSDSFLDTTYSAANVTMMPKEELQNIIALKQLVRTVSMIAAPILGAVLYQLVSFEVFVGIEIASEILTLLIVLGINFTLVPMDGEAEHDNSEKGILQMFREGIDYIRGKNVLVFLVVFSMVINFLLSSFQVALPYLKVTVFGFSDLEVGIGEMVFAGGLLLAGIVVSRIKNFKNPLYTAWVLLFIIYLAQILIAGLVFSKPVHAVSFWGLTTILLITGFFLGVINIPMGVWASQNIPQNMQGRVFNLMGAMAQLLSPLGMYFFALLLDGSFGADRILFATAVVGIVISLLLPRLFKVNWQESITE